MCSKDCRQYTLVDYGKHARSNNPSSAFQRIDTGHDTMVTI